MAINWNDYELVLIAEDRKECEVTGRDMGGQSRYTRRVSELEKDKEVIWNGYGGYDAVRCKFMGTDDEAIHLIINCLFNRDTVLKPGEKWESGWYSFGSWEYYVTIKLEKIEKEENKPFFVHTMTDDGVTSDYADAKEAYGG